MGFRLSGLDGSNDFDELGGVAIIGSGETSVTVRVSTTDDATDERDETFTLRLSNPTNATLGERGVSGARRTDDWAGAGRVG